MIFHENKNEVSIFQIEVVLQMMSLYGLDPGEFVEWDRKYRILEYISKNYKLLRNQDSKRRFYTIDLWLINKGLNYPKVSNQLSIQDDLEEFTFKLAKESSIATKEALRTILKSTTFYIMYNNYDLYSCESVGYMFEKLRTELSGDMDKWSRL